jgi:hypothetical protein
MRGVLFVLKVTDVSSFFLAVEHAYRLHQRIFDEIMYSVSKSYRAMAKGDWVR